MYRRWPALQRLACTRQYWYREWIAMFLRRPSRTGLLQAIARARLPLDVADAVLRAKLTPAHRMGCERIVVSDGYHRTLSRGKVELITSSIDRIDSSSIVTEDSVERPVDTVVLRTSFHLYRAADPVRGRDGVMLAERWSQRRQAYLGTTVAG